MSLNYAENQPCGLPATRAESYDGAVNEFLCDTPRLARFVSVDIDPSSPGVTNAILQLAEVRVEEITSGACGGIEGKTILEISTNLFSPFLVCQFNHLCFPHMAAREDTKCP